MDKHWDNFCTMSIVHFMAYPKCINGEAPIAESVSKIAEDPFFGGIELTWIKDSAEREATKNVIAATHIQLGYGGQPAVLLGKLNLNSLDEGERKVAVVGFKERIDEAVEMGAKRIAFLSGKDPGGKDRGAAVKALVKSVKDLCAYGREKGIALTCETFDRDVDKKALIGPSALAAEFAAQVRADYPEFGLMYDLSHQPLLGEKSEDALIQLREYLVHIHVGNCVVTPGVPGYGDLHPRFGWPGGSNDVAELAEFIRALFKVGYLREGKKARPWVGFEVKPQTADETPEQVIAGTKRAWQEAWALA
jgi:sugar phosphate isomerase/epimerase